MSITHLLYGRRIIALPYPHASEEDTIDPDYTPYTAPIVRESFSRQAQILKHFEGRWKQEYLTALREFYKVKLPKQSRLEMWFSYMMTHRGLTGRWQ